MFSCIGTEGSEVSLFRNGWFRCFFCLGTEGFKGSLLRNGWFQWFSVYQLKVPMVNYLEMGGSNGFLFRN